MLTYFVASTGQYRGPTRPWNSSAAVLSVSGLIRGEDQPTTTLRERSMEDSSLDDSLLQLVSLRD